MSDAAYENAMKRRDEISFEIRELETRLALLKSDYQRVDAFIEQWHEFAGTPLLDRSPTAVRPPRRWVGGREAPTRNSKKEEVAAVARRIIEAEGKPIPRSELYKRLIAEGLTISGSDPEMVLSTMLWRMKDQIVRLQKGGYWLADRPYESEYYSGDKELDELMGSVDESEDGVDATIPE